MFDSRVDVLGWLAFTCSRRSKPSVARVGRQATGKVLSARPLRTQPSNGTVRLLYLLPSTKLGKLGKASLSPSLFVGKLIGAASVRDTFGKCRGGIRQRPLRRPGPPLSSLEDLATEHRGSGLFVLLVF